MFDGADEEGPVDINAFIGKKAEVIAAAASRPAKEIDVGLLSAPAHNLRLAFFPVKNNEPTADYEMNIKLHENGVVSDMFIEYDDFSINQTLLALEPVKSACAGSGPKQ